MKSLILIRHAKSSWEYDVIDHQRPLKKRGVNDAHLVATKLKDLNFEVDKVLISDAMRTRLTAEIILPALNIPENIVSYHHKLYDFSGRDLVNVIKKCDTTINTLMIFGHNHAVTAFVNTFGNIFIDNVPTCGVIVIQFQTNTWAEIISGETIHTIFPRDLKV